MYWDKTGIGQIDQVFSGFKTGHICLRLCRIHRFWG